VAASTKSDPPVEPVERGMLADVLTYPLRSDGWLMIAIGAGFSILMYIARWAPMIGGVVAIFAAGFFAAYYLDIINSTVNGSDDPPDWPSISDFKEDILLPLVNTLGIALISWGPLLLTQFIDKTWEAKEACEVGAFAFAVIYFPMATLGYVMHGHLGGALPHRVVPAIFRALPGYLIVIVLFTVLTSLSTVSDVISRVPLIGIVLTAAPSLYLLMAQGRLIGLLYRSKREQIGWG
jgi:hypothetical protein